MVNRLTDNLRKSADKAENFSKVEEIKRPQLFVEFINGIKVAAGCSHQLAHARIDQSPHWLDIRDKLEKVIEIGQHLPTLSGETVFLWNGIASTLKSLAVNIEKLFDMPGMKMSEVDAILTQRLKNADELN